MKKFILLMIVIVFGMWLLIPTRRNHLEDSQEEQIENHLVANQTAERLVGENDVEVDTSDLNSDQVLASERIRTFINLYGRCTD